MTEYIQAAMACAHYEIIEDERTFWGEIPGFQGVWGKADILEKCREELKEALEEWIIFRFKNNLELPALKCLKALLKETQTLPQAKSIYEAQITGEVMAYRAAR